MHEFPDILTNELTELFKSVAIDDKGITRPFSGDWNTRRVTFGSLNNRQSLNLQFTHITGFEIELTLFAEDFRLHRSTGSSTELSSLASELSMLVEQEVFTRNPDEFEYTDLRLKPSGIVDGVRKTNLGALLKSKGISGWHLVKDQEAE